MCKLKCISVAISYFRSSGSFIFYSFVCIYLQPMTFTFHINTPYPFPWPQSTSLNVFLFFFLFYSLVVFFLFHVERIFFKLLCFLVQLFHCIMFFDYFMYKGQNPSKMANMDDRWSSQINGQQKEEYKFLHLPKRSIRPRSMIEYNHSVIGLR